MWWALVACEPPLGVGVPWLEVPDRVEVTAWLDASATAPVEIRNTGTGVAFVEAAVEPASAEFSVDSGTLRIPPGGAAAVLLTFRPGAPAAVGGTLVVDSGFDRFPVPLSGLVDLDADDDGARTPLAGGDDCDDRDPARAPGLAEVCNGVDDDCSGVVDDPADPPVWYRDADDDGAGDDGTARATCDRPDGFVAAGGDCDDADPDVFPGAAEAWYDGVDQDCDGADDFDQDRDGVRIDADDCDDLDPGVAPGLPEIWYDGVDQDCDGNDDDQDGDGDPVAVDCDDTDPAFGPSAPEIWYDGADQDCDGNDDDQDGDGEPVAVDCDDLDPTVAPGFPEVDDGRDQDCDGLRDEGLWAHGTLLVTEILENPRVTPDALGRFVELVNVSDGDVDLGALTLTVGPDTTPFAARWLAPGDVVVACVEADPLRNGGVPCVDVVAWSDATPAAVTLAVAATGFVVDELPLNGFTVPNGAARELRADRFDPDRNDAGASWCTALDPFGDGDRGTPGSATPSCP